MSKDYDDTFKIDRSSNEWLPDKLRGLANVLQKLAEDADNGNLFVDNGIIELKSKGVTVPSIDGDDPDGPTICVKTDFRRYRISGAIEFTSRKLA